MPLATSPATTREALARRSVAITSAPDEEVDLTGLLFLAVSDFTFVTFDGTPPGKMYLEHFALPEGSSVGERAYSFKYSNAFFIVLDSNLPPGFSMPNHDDTTDLREDEDPLEEEPLGEGEEGEPSGAAEANEAEPNQEA